MASRSLVTRLRHGIWARLVAHSAVLTILSTLATPSAHASFPSAGQGESALPRLAQHLPDDPPVVLLCVVTAFTYEDVAGASSDGYTYSAFGELLAHTGDDPQPYAFTGEPLDPNSGWQYHRARWMDPSTGRFAGMDPVAGLAFEPHTLHKYLYVGMNPLNDLDPSGELSLANIAVVGAIISGVFGGFSNALGAGTPREFLVRFTIGALANGAATYIAFLVANPLAQGAISGGLSQVFTTLWENRNNPRRALDIDNVSEVLVASLIGAFAGGVVAQRFRHLLIPKHKDLWQNVWMGRSLGDFTVNVRFAIASGAVGGAIGSSIGRLIMPHVDKINDRLNLEAFF